MTYSESIEVVARAAEAMASAHQQGIVHRDLKPSNIMLEGGRVDAVRLLDFGIARLTRVMHAMTTPGAVLGTPSYMAPEQARGDAVGAPADVWSLGCVLFECLTGRPPFEGEHALAILGKVLLEEAPSVWEARRDVSPALAALVAQALMKEPLERPRDGADLAERLRTLPTDRLSAQEQRAATKEHFIALTRGEQELVSVLIAGRLPPEGATIAIPTGTQVEHLANGTMMMVVSSEGSPADRATHVARTALRLRQSLPAEMPLALATGRALRGASRLPVGAAVDRAVELLDMSVPGLRIDALTAGLLPPRFELVGDGAGLLLAGERDVFEPVRTLLGKETPCVGRKREMALLEGAAEDCFEEERAHAMVLVGEAGSGKSRLRYELQRTLAGRAQTWVGRGDPMRATTGFGLVADALSRELGLRAGEPPEAQRQRVRARVERWVPHAQQQRVSALLGELVAVPFPDDDSDVLRTARADPGVMAVQMRVALEDFVAAELAGGPILFVLEDLHWADSASVGACDQLLRNLAERPLLLVATARPEIEARFPRLWQERVAERIDVRPLSPASAHELIDSVLGEQIDPSISARIVDQASGHTLLLEELIRAEMQGISGVPTTALAMMEARVTALEGDARRVLRAASIIGRRFWRGSLGALLAGGEQPTYLSRWLDALVARELITRQPGSRFAGETEYWFTHALVRDASYAMLTDHDRVLGHRLAAEWLANAGERDTAVLAEHRDRGGQPERAAVLWVDASIGALRASALDEALSRARRAHASGVRGEAAGRAWLVEAEACRSQGETELSARAGAKAMELLPVGSRSWGDASGALAAAYAGLGRAAELEALGRRLLELGAAPGLVTARLQTAVYLYPFGRAELARELRSSAGDLAGDPAAEAWGHRLDAAEAALTGDDALTLAALERSVGALERAGDLRLVVVNRVNLAHARSELGDYPRAAHALRGALEWASRLGLTHVRGGALQNLGLVLARLGQLDEALQYESEAVELYRGSDMRMEGSSRLYLAEILRLAGNIDSAEVEASRADALFAEGAPSNRPRSLSALTHLHLSRGRTVEALATARAAMEIVDRGEAIRGESVARLALAEALFATGAIEEAREATSLAQKRLMARADHISDTELRSSFLENVPAHARTLELATR